MEITMTPQEQLIIHRAVEMICNEWGLTKEDAIKWLLDDDYWNGDCDPPECRGETPSMEEIYKIMQNRFEERVKLPAP
jgi:hypothetical protein